MIHLSVAGQLLCLRYLEQQSLSSWFVRHAPRGPKYWPVCDGAYLFLSVSLCANGLLGDTPLIIATPVSEEFFRYLEVLYS